MANFHMWQSCKLSENLILPEIAGNIGYSLKTTTVLMYAVTVVDDVAQIVTYFMCFCVNSSLIHG